MHRHLSLSLCHGNESVAARQRCDLQVQRSKLRVSAFIQKIFGCTFACMNLNEPLIHRNMSLAKMSTESTLTCMN